MNTKEILLYQRFTTAILAGVGVRLHLEIDLCQLGVMYGMPLVTGDVLEKSTKPAYSMVVAVSYQVAVGV
jgi:hypothetical protein